MVRVSSAVMGIEFSYAAETAFVSPTLLKIGKFFSNNNSYEFWSYVSRGGTSTHDIGLGIESSCWFPSDPSLRFNQR